jgi:hypothetical protein
LGLAEAVQEAAFVLDQVSITVCPSVTVAETVVIVTVGINGGGLDPPLHAFTRKQYEPLRNSATQEEDLFM